MSEHARSFVRHLQRLNGEPVGETVPGKGVRPRDRGAMAALRRSLSFDPGTYPRAFPYVEPFMGSEQPYRDARRRAYYLAAGLYALNPIQCDQPFARSLAHLAHKRIGQGGSADGVESRLMALLGSQSENVGQYLRQLTTLLAAENGGCDYAALTDDLCIWMNPFAGSDGLDRIRQKWARQFYQVAVSVDE
ncbi:type I-E CRISPR-associated protein Cse2/CasB [Candidimonas nitroreducens]|uniref:Type I-E CRISPR-associated protein Cse2/CasB n=1 Tax=Candidimonas nitroreducens TaxID=683354 RepID=A0A225MKV0_9BURK|nr:type I-E CRISPR-associated protein Cse2/CasB [Candidimonas nitroreducens]OWT60151.1 type I-E CRISPR-associated protein Cse2/CasB [Candidimonas nitroreducens]